MSLKVCVCVHAEISPAAKLLAAHMHMSQITDSTGEQRGELTDVFFTRDEETSFSLHWN